MTRVRSRLPGPRFAAALLAVPMALTPMLTTPAQAQWIVYDPTNYVQNVLTAARALQQINNQITSLANETQMLVNQAKNLASLPTSVLSQLQSNLTKTQTLLTQAQNIAYSVNQIETAFSGTYGSVSSSASTSSLVSTAQTRWQNSVAGFEDSLKVQAGVVGNISSNSTAMSSLVSASQSATGALQAAQAGNQILALQSQQLSDLVAVLSAKGRADALEQARQATAEAQGQQQYKNFSTRTGYVSGAVTMFSN